ncbi:UbiA-like protein EboC [Croceitalea rosinachiae]|uniref:UbiA-like protein EboC n=1 Tax=Croceitalea rosinachiae TaxID=3075596 RepID=A0ABU3AET9_9FLAO|nr:UbiA-like protein EboC [Croceitalea sp. F388]MDT0608504.1 UbiA-like protein EboC [Croceitalea sp. F388]
MNPKIRGYLQLCRPANLPTAAADVLAGLAIAGFFVNQISLFNSSGWLLVFASIFLYAGGVVLNDVFDVEIDKIERPERPISSGLIKLQDARLFGFCLLLLGVGGAFLSTIESGLVALILAVLILTYDAFSKNHPFLGPLNMGLCRGCNLLMGISVFGNFDKLEYIIIPVIYIAAITRVSQGEVHGKNKRNIVLAGILYAVVVFLLMYFNNALLSLAIYSYVFLVLFVLAIGIPLFRAFHENTPINIKKAVKAGVISIILLDAAIAVPFSNILIGVLILLLLPISILLSKAFAVT